MAETIKNALSTQKVENTLITQQDFFVSQIKNLFSKQNIPLSDYQVKCGNNAVAKMVQMAQANNKDIFQYPQGQTLFTLQNIIANEWDVLQGEGVIIFQNKKIMVEAKDKYGKPMLKDGKQVMTAKYEQYFDLRPTAKGHIKTLRMYGASLDKVNPVALNYVVYEGDEFEDVSYVGTEVTPPKYRPKRLSNRVKFIVYALNMNDGTVQYVVGRRENVVPALISQAKNNGAPEYDLKKMNDLGNVDEILNEYENKTFDKKRYDQTTKKWETEKVPYFNDTWLQGYNREQMLETKLRGVIANRMIEKEFNNKFQKEAFEHVIIDKPKDGYVNRDVIDHEEQSQELIEQENMKKTFKTDARNTKTLVITDEPTDDEEQSGVVEEPQEQGEPIEAMEENHEEEIIETEETVDTEPEIIENKPKSDNKKSSGFNFGDGFGI